MDDLIPPLDERGSSLYNSVIVDSIPQRRRPQTSESLKPELPQAVANDDDDDDSPDSKWKLLRVTANAHDGWVRSVCVDPLNTFVASGGADAVIKVWDMTAVNVKAEITGHILPVRALAVSQRYPYLFSGAEDKTVKCWDLERSHTPHSLVRDYYGHVGGVYAVTLHPELDLLFTAGRDQVVRVWDIRSRTQVMLLQGHTNDISGLVTQAMDPQVISSLMDKTVCLWDLRKQQRALQITQHTKSVRAIALHPKELTFTLGDLSGRYMQWLLPRGQLLQKFATASPDKIIETMSINPMTNEIIGGYANGKLEVWDYERGVSRQTLHSTVVNTTEPSPIFTSAFDMLGSRLYTGEGDKSIKVWGNGDLD